jgi:small-conductance mechanosensitive channel
LRDSPQRASGRRCSGPSTFASVGDPQPDEEGGRAPQPHRTDLRPLLLDAPSVMGVESIEMNRITIRMVARTLPGRQFEVGRDLRALISQVFLQEGMNLPTDLDTMRTPVA